VDPAITRPTTDKNKEMIFNILGQYFNGGVALDLFAGSGALGIEALSRGIELCHFVDISHFAVRIIHENLKTLKIESRSASVTQNEALQYLHRYSGRAFDIIFLDPPYALDVIPEVLKIINESTLLSPSGVIVCETDKQRILPEMVGNLTNQREKIEGVTKFTFYLWRE
jgi:16S rRNA (guanine(966)-N(2))-methyltransferase RsmD